MKFYWDCSPRTALVGMVLAITTLVLPAGLLIFFFIDMTRCGS